MSGMDEAIEVPDRARRATYAQRLARRAADAPLAPCVGQCGLGCEQIHHGAHACLVPTLSHFLGALGCGQKPLAGVHALCACDECAVGLPELGVDIALNRLQFGFLGV